VQTRHARTRAGAGFIDSSLDNLAEVASGELRRMGQVKRCRVTLALMSGEPRVVQVDTMSKVPVSRARLAQRSGMPPAVAASVARDDSADHGRAAKRLKVATALDRANRENDPRFANVPT
jgi:hypothetical protein